MRSPRSARPQSACGRVRPSDSQLGDRSRLGDHHVQLSHHRLPAGTACSPTTPAGLFRIWSSGSASLRACTTSAPATGTRTGRACKCSPRRAGGCARHARRRPRRTVLRRARRRRNRTHQVTTTSEVTDEDCQLCRRRDRGQSRNRRQPRTRTRRLGRAASTQAPATLTACPRPRQIRAMDRGFSLGWGVSALTARGERLR